MVSATQGHTAVTHIHTNAQDDDSSESGRNLMRLGRFPFEVQKFLSSGDILLMASEDGTRRVMF